MNEEELNLLRNFFGGYFHQDWPCEADSPEDVIGAYSQDAALEEKVALSGAILRYIQFFKNDADLEDGLCSELGSEYRPSLDGLSARAWLTEISSRLLKD